MLACLVELSSLLAAVPPPPFWKSPCGAQLEPVSFALPLTKVRINSKGDSIANKYLVGILCPHVLLF